VGTTTLTNGQTISARSDLGNYFDQQFTPLGYTVGFGGGNLTISKASVASFTASPTVLAPISATVSGTASHWSVADIQFSGTASAGDTWHLILVRRMDRLRRIVVTSSRMPQATASSI
jgi:hypothetical protein